MVWKDMNIRGAKDKKYLFQFKTKTLVLPTKSAHSHTELLWPLCKLFLLPLILWQYHKFCFCHILLYLFTLPSRPIALLACKRISALFFMKFIFLPNKWISSTYMSTIPDLSQQVQVLPKPPTFLIAYSEAHLSRTADKPSSHFR